MYWQLEAAYAHGAKYRQPYHNLCVTVESTEGLVTRPVKFLRDAICRGIDSGYYVVPDNAWQRAIGNITVSPFSWHLGGLAWSFVHDLNTGKRPDGLCGCWRRIAFGFYWAPHKAAARWRRYAATRPKAIVREQPALWLGGVNPDHPAYL
jgi:hypothetical protein